MELNDVKKMAGEMAEKVTETLKKDPDLLKKFKADPVATLKSMSGIDLPDESLQALAAAVKAKLAAGDVGDIASKLGKLF